MKPISKLPSPNCQFVDLTHEFRREQNRRKLRANSEAFVCGLLSGVFLLLTVFLAVYLVTH